MKNTKYQDVFDFGAEALSIENKFNGFNFPNSQNAHKIGETIRGMSNVSPLATVKLFNQTSKDLVTKYYPDAKKLQTINSTLILDDTINKNGFSFYKYEFFSDRNRNNFINSGEELAFKLLLFVSTDGNKVKECYEAVKPNDDEIIFFIETDDDTLSNDVLYGRVSDSIKKAYTDQSSGKLYKAFFDGDIMETINKYASNVNKEIIEELFLRGFIEKKGVKEGIFNFLRYIVQGISAPAKILGWILNKLGNGIDFLRIPDSLWDTENPEYFFQKDKLIQSLSIPKDKIELIRNLFTDKKGFDLSDLNPKVVNEIILNQVSVMGDFVENYNSYVKNEIEDIFKTLESPQMQEQTDNLAEKVALICGIWNGLIDFISSVFKFFGSLLEAPFSISKDFQQTLEMIDNFWDILRDKNLVKNLKNAINDGIKQIVIYLKKQNLDDINWVRVHYIGGFTISFAGTFFIPIADIAKIGEIGKVGEILTKINSEIGKTISQTAKFVKIETAQAYQKSSKALENLLALFNAGGKKLQDFINNLWKKIADWFLKNKKLVEATWIKAQKIFSKESKYDAIYRDITKKFFIQNVEVMSESQFYKLASKIKEAFKIDMLIVDRNNEKYSELFKLWQNNPIYAVFHEKTFINTRYGLELEGPAVYFFKGIARGSHVVEITAYTMQHELLHLKLWHKMVIEFPELTNLYRKMPRVLDELNVVGEMLKQNTKKVGKWSLEDIQNDINVINDTPKWKPHLKEYFGKENVEINDFKNWDLSKYLKQVKE
ncbi:hypothetical protein CJF12_13365 [Chryseobacterium piperi]|uniref:hypothetical protein n=1 Tax=Chryseobacterium piperi TaxID=558152 RepID=UPI00068EADBB|nr:hypothetical protein [Chryseobacterium piperi]ASW75174.2 hypothetical protein CJF12_13365 [Chryseobacterium piperi]